MLLLLETLRVTGLGRGLAGGLARWRASRAVHVPGKILTDLAVALAVGGDCLADIGVLRAQPQLCGPVASDPVVSRLVTAWRRTCRGRWARSARRRPLPGSGRGRWPGSGLLARMGR